MCCASIFLLCVVVCGFLGLGWVRVGLWYVYSIFILYL